MLRRGGFRQGRVAPIAIAKRPITTATVSFTAELFMLLPPCILPGRRCPETSSISTLSGCQCQSNPRPVTRFPLPNLPPSEPSGRVADGKLQTDLNGAD